MPYVTDQTTYPTAWHQWYALLCEYRPDDPMAQKQGPLALWIRQYESCKKCDALRIKLKDKTLTDNQKSNLEKELKRELIVETVLSEELRCHDLDLLRSRKD